MDSFHVANILFIDEKYAAAVEKYNSCEAELKKFAPLHACRSAAYLKLKQFTEALEDANAAIAIDATHEPSHFRKGVALFELEEYESSKQCFELSVELALKQGKKDVSAQNRWIRKCESEMEDESEEEERIAATTQKIETPKVAPAPVPQMSKKVLPDIRYQYYQSATSMNISIMAKNLTADDVVVEFSTKHLLVRVKQDGQEGIFVNSSCL
jgi:suppressor of G2 allele of SKP1